MTGATLVTSSGYLTQPSRTRGRHRKQPPPRRFLSGRSLAVGGSAVLLAALVVSVGTVVKWATHEPVSVPNARPSTPVAAGPPASPSLPPAQPLSPPAAAPDPFPVDDRGFVNSGARCEGTQTAIAIGRTPGSLVVICGDRNGRYGYRGLRLSDDAVLTTSARSHTDSRIHCAERERHLLDLRRRTPRHRRRRGHQTGADDRLPRTYVLASLRSAPRNRTYRTRPVSATNSPVD